MIGQRIGWMGAPALFAGGAAGVVVAGGQLSQQGEDDRGLGAGDIFAGLGVGAAATVGTLVTASRIGSAGRPPAGRAASIVIGGVVGSLLGVGAGMGVAALRGSQQAARRDERIESANERLHERVKDAPEESTSWTVDGARETSGWGTIATGAGAITGAGIGMQLRRVASGSPARLALGAVGLLAGGIGAGAGARELMLRRSDASVDDTVSSPVPKLPADPPAVGTSRKLDLAAGALVGEVEASYGDEDQVIPLRFVEWASDRTFATEEEVRTAFEGLAPHGWSVDGTKTTDTYGDPDIDPRFDTIVAIRSDAGYHLAYAKLDDEPGAPSKRGLAKDVTAIYADDITGYKRFDLRGTNEDVRDWHRDSFDQYEPPVDGTHMDAVAKLFRDEYVESALEVGAEGYGYANEELAVAAMRRLPGDQQVVEIRPDDDHHDSVAITKPRYFVIEPAPHRSARAEPGIRIRDEHVELEGEYDGMRLHHRDVAREVDGVEMIAHDGFFLTPGKVTDGTFD